MSFFHGFSGIASFLVVSKAWRYGNDFSGDEVHCGTGQMSTKERMENILTLKKMTEVPGELVGPVLANSYIRDPRRGCQPGVHPVREVHCLVTCQVVVLWDQHCAASFYLPFLTLFIFWSLPSSPSVLPRPELAFYVVSISAL